MGARGREVVREDGWLPSSVLERGMEFIWFGKRGRPVVLFPTSAGRQNENVDFGLVDALQPLLEKGAIQAVSIDSINRESWAEEGLDPQEKLRRQALYDRFLSEELFPFVAGQSGGARPIVYGASLGAWQAVTFAARHPEQVGRVVAFSGFYDVRQLLDGWWSDDCYFFSPGDFIPNMDASWVARLQKLEWVLATGDGDALQAETLRLGSILSDKGIPNRTEIWPHCFGHDWPYWKKHLPRFVV